MKLRKSHTQTDCLHQKCKTTSIRWVLDTVCNSIWFPWHACSPTLPQHYFMSPALTSSLLHPQLMTLPPAAWGKNGAIRQVLLHLPSIPYTTTHIQTHFLHLLSNSTEERLCLGYRSPPPQPMAFPGTFLLHLTLFRLHLWFLPQVTPSHPHLLVFMPLYLSSPEVWLEPITHL